MASYVVGALITIAGGGAGVLCEANGRLTTEYVTSRWYFWPILALASAQLSAAYITNLLIGYPTPQSTMVVPSRPVAVLPLQVAGDNDGERERKAMESHMPTGVVLVHMCGGGFTFGFLKEGSTETLCENGAHTMAQHQCRADDFFRYVEAI